MLVSEIRIGSEAGFRVPMLIDTEIKAERAASSRWNRRRRPESARGRGGALLRQAIVAMWINANQYHYMSQKHLERNTCKEQAFLPLFVTSAQRKNV
ncbi:hypothetical protein CR51_04190 [Caballeronia megalochromosomata]|nr:hypothetical protein CR51_04190 [Caballeronia megalochromosomata]